MLSFLVLFGLLAIPGRAAADTSASDNFARANGSLGPNWQDDSEGGLAISSDSVVGTNASGNSGDVWVGNSFTGDQYSQITLTSTQLTGTQWIGAAVRAGNGGQDAYVGIYFWDNGSPALMLFVRHGGTGWAQLGSTYPVSPLPAGTQLELTATGSSLSFTMNGTQAVSATDTTITGGQPGIIANGTARAATWAGGGAIAPTYTVGGAVSGLSGTLVLEDNGGDNLSVTGNGAFTFPTPLADGTGYAVTVASSPAGETCSVSGGSGTVSGGNVTSAAVSCSSVPAGSTASDDFARANGSLGPNWTDISDGGLTISSDTVVGTNPSGNSGDIWTGSTFTSNQYSTITLTSTQLTGTQWIGAAVRAQNGGQDAYVGIYFWNNGSPALMLFLRHLGNWAQLGTTYPVSPLPAGTQLELSVIGSSLSFTMNGTQAISATDTTITGGQPGIIANEAGSAASWAGGNAGPPPGPSYTVGGTVSGLSGTIVLQDNGGDNASVTSNGAFTFPTPLADGAGYNVTIASNPAGQACSVSDGTGTVSGGNVTNVTVSCSTVQAAPSASTASDNFARANGSLGPNWTGMSDGGLTISSDAVVGTNPSGNSGDIWTGSTFTSDQYSTITLTSTQLTGTQWIGAAVRAQNGGQDAYVGIYFWNSGSPMLMLFARTDGSNWTQVGDSASVAPLPAGSQLTLTAIGNTLSFDLNGVPEVYGSDSTLAGGQPGIIANEAGLATNWSAGNAGPSFTYTGTDPTGIESYQILSANDGYGPQTLRVLQPTHPAAGVPHNFLIVLPVEPGLGTQFGDGLATMQSLDAEDQYNLTIVEPTFAIDPWYANDATDPNLQYETFLTNELVPWMKANLATTGSEQTWLIGFSKSGLGAQDLILKHPDLFTLAASWDFPADISSYNQYSDSSANYGTAANFTSNYQLTQSFIDAHAAPFTTSNRIWIGSFNLFGTDVADYDTRLTTAGIQHTTEPPTGMVHSWTSGWVPTALAALSADSAKLGG